MLFKFAAVLFSTVLQTAVLAGASSTRLGSDVLDVGDGDQEKNFVRKMKKEKDSKKSKNEGKDEGEDEESDEDIFSLQDGETGEVGIPSLIPSLRTNGITLDGFDDISDWNHGSYAVSSGNVGSGRRQLKVYAPEYTQVGDYLFLFLSRTDGLLPLRIQGWRRGTECFKTNNRQESCLREPDCVDKRGAYCYEFRRDGMVGNGRDLGTVLFYRRVVDDTPGCFDLEVPGNSRVWAVITAITNVDEDRPIRRVSGKSCDRDTKSAFPSVYGVENDVLLLSQCFDDTAVINQFRPPDGTSLLGWTNAYDEAGFLYGKKLDATGHTGQLVTRGNGGPTCKDALLSVVVRRNV